MRHQQRRRPAVWLLVLFLLFFAPATGNAAPRAVAWVSAGRGDLQVVRAGTHDPVPLRLGDRLYPRDHVRTGRSGRAQLQFFDGPPTKLDANTEVEITVSGVGGQNLLQILFGRLWMRLLPARRREHIELTTPAGNMAKEGTEFIVEVKLDAGRTTTLTVLDGRVRFWNEHGTVVLETTREQPALASTARIGQAPSPPVTVPDVSGLLIWTADVAALPLEFELPSLPTNPTEVEKRLSAVEARLPALAAPGGLAFAMALAERGHLRRARGDIAGAIEDFEVAWEIAPDRSETAVGLALALMTRAQVGGDIATGALERARVVLDSALPDAMARAVLGLLDLRENRPEAAIANLEAAVAAQTDLFQARALLALAYLTRNRVADAEQTGRAAVARNPGSAQAQGTLAMVLFFARKTDEARRAAETAVRLKPRSPFALLAQGRILLSLLRIDDAFSAYQQAAILAPDLWIVQAELGAVYARLDHLPRAEAAYRRAVELARESADAHTGLGAVLMARGDFAGAEREHREALRLASDNIAALGNLGELLIRAGRLNEARALLESNRLERPERGRLYALSAEANLYQQNLFAAQEDAHRAVQLLPDSALAHYQLGRVYLELGRTAQAEQRFRLAATLDRRFSSARFALGFTRDLLEASQDPSQPFAAPVTTGLETSSSALGLNFQAPGAADRLQAAIQNPSVTRVATRSFGATQLDLAIGEQGRQDTTISHLQETNNRRGIQGIAGERNFTRGIRHNADVERERVSVMLGQRAEGSPSSVFFLGEFEHHNEGLDRGEDSDALLASGRSSDDRPNIVLGFGQSLGENSQTLALLQYSQPRSKTMISVSRLDIRLRNLSAELRRDIRLGEKHFISFGGSLGVRYLDSETLTLFSQALPDVSDELLRFDASVQSVQLYFREEFRASHRLTLLGDLQYQILKRNFISQNVEPVLEPEERTKETTASWFPNIVADYRPNEHDGFRLRARRLFGTIEDFQLLAPRDNFLSSTAELPHLRPQGSGNSIEVEYYHTFRSASFFLVSAFDQRLTGAQEPAMGSALPRVRQQGLRMVYQGSLAQQTTFFIDASFSKSMDQEKGRDVQGVPRSIAGAGLQYLNRQGWFFQPTVSYLGSRRRYMEELPIRTGSIALYSLRAGRRWGLRSVLYLEVTNLTDKSYVYLGNRGLGRQLRLGTVYRF